MKTKRAAIYARVSTDSQSCENQLRELRRVAAQNEWVVVDEYVDQGISGSKGRDKRPAFDALLNAAVRKDFDVVMAFSVDRLGRSLQHLIAFLGEIHSKGVDLYLHQQGVDTTTPAGTALFQMLGVFSQFERAMIRDRVKAGLARAKEKGRVGGRPPVSPKITQAILDKRTAGLSIRKIAAEVGVGISTVQRTLKANQQAA